MNLLSNNNFYNFFPFITTFISFIFMSLPLLPSGMGEITPMIGVIVLAYWLIYLGHLMPFYAVFTLGLLFDVLTGTIFGLGGFAAIISKLIIIQLTKQKYKTSAIQTFLLIILILILWNLIIAFPIIIMNFKTLNYLPLLFQILCSITLSPLLIIILNFFLRKMERYSYD